MFFVLMIMAAFVIFGLWVFVAIKSKAPKKYSNEWRNNYKEMATRKQKTLAGAHIEVNAEDEITPDELFDLMGDELKEYEAVNTKKWIGVTEDGKVLYQADNITEAEKYSVTYQIKHTIKINPDYKSEKQNEKQN